MDHTTRAFIALIQQSIGGCEMEDIMQQDIDWKELFHMAGMNKLLALTYSELVKYKEKAAIPIEVVEDWKQNTMAVTMNEYKNYYSLRLLLERAKQEQLKLVLFKGCILAALYPKYVLRCSSDTDIFVYYKERDRAILLLTELGYCKKEESSKQEVYVCRQEKTGHVIELHTCLWEDFKGPKMERLKHLELTREDTLISLNVCDMEVLTLGYKEHLVYQMFHIVKHFILEGISIRYMLDIALYVNHYIKEIAIEEFWTDMEIVGYTKFCEYFFVLCNQYFFMTREIFRGRNYPECQEQESLLWDLIHLGKVVEHKNAGWQLLGIMTPYLVGEEQYRKKKGHRMIKVLFPSQRALPARYDYAKKHKVLLPIAWVHKLGGFIIKRNRHKKDWYAPTEKLQTIEHRFVLLDQLGLTEHSKQRDEKEDLV